MLQTAGACWGIWGGPSCQFQAGCYRFYPDQAGAEQSSAKDHAALGRRLLQAGVAPEVGPEMRGTKSTWGGGEGAKSDRKLRCATKDYGLNLQSGGRGIYPITFYLCSWKGCI